MLRWPESTIFEGIAAVAADQPDRPALVAEDTTRTYSELVAEARALAAGLADRGVGEGDMVAVWLGNRPEWTVTLLAASALGAAVVAVNTRYRTHELEYMLQDSSCRVLVTEESFLGRDLLSMVAELAPGLETETPETFDPDAFPALTDVVTLDTAPAYPATRTYDDLVDAGRGGDVTTASDPTATACVFYTSGTTGDPKGCLQTNRSLLNHSYQGGVHLGLRDDDVALGLLPFCGVWGFNTMLGALSHGLPLVAQSHFDPARAIEAVERHGVSYCSGLATMFHRMVGHESFAPERVATLRRGAVGFLSMGFDETVFDELEAALGFPLVQPYGLSEANSQVFVGVPTDPPELRKRVGGPLVHPEEEQARVVDPETGEECPPGEPGELLLKGYNVISGYHEKPEQTAEDIVDGWLHTGDLVTCDERGYYAFESRLDDALRVRGFLVTPREIETVIDGHPDVAASQVVGVPHPRHGQVPVAFVIRADKTLTAEGLRAYVDDHAADYKVPEAVRFVDEFPRSEGPHGEKVQKHALRERVVDLFTDGGE